MQAPNPPIVIHHAETGRSFHLAVEASNSSVSTLSTALEPATGIPYAHQILLLDGMKLEEQRSLSEYGLPAHGRPIFLFSRRSLSRNAPPPERQAVPPLELEVPTELTPEQQPRPAALVVPPLVGALVDYERHFCLHLLQARTISEVGGARLAASSQCLHELTVQGAAQHVAAANLHSFAQQLADRYADFEQQCASLVPQQKALVASFEDDVAALRSIEVDEAVCRLEGWSHATLLDACGEERLRAWLRECLQTTEHLVAKQAQFAHAYAELLVGISAADEPCHGAVSREEADAQLQAAALVRQQQDEIVARLASDVHEVRVLVDGQLEVPSREGALAACGALDLKNGIHAAELLPRLRELDAELRGAQDVMSAAKHEASVQLYTRLRVISQLQSSIAELRNRLQLYGTLLARVRMYCEQLHLMRRLPSTYLACLEEVIMRQRVQEATNAQIRHTAETVAAAREQEAQRRDEFMREHGVLLPRGLPALSALLQARPPYVEFSTSVSDVRLMEFSTAIERTSSTRAALGASRLTLACLPSAEPSAEPRAEPSAEAAAAAAAAAAAKAAAFGAGTVLGASVSEEGERTAVLGTSAAEGEDAAADAADAAATVAKVAAAAAAAALAAADAFAVAAAGAAAAEGMAAAEIAGDESRATAEIVEIAGAESWATAAVAEAGTSTAEPVAATAAAEAAEAAPVADSRSIPPALATTPTPVADSRSIPPALATTPTTGAPSSLALVAAVQSPERRAEREMSASSDDAAVAARSPVPPPAPSPTPMASRAPSIVRSMSEHSALDSSLARAAPGGRGAVKGANVWNSAALEALEDDATIGVGFVGFGLGSTRAVTRAVASDGASSIGSSVPSVPRRVLTDPVRLPGTAELSAALEALGTPLEGY